MSLLAYETEANAFIDEIDTLITQAKNATNPLDKQAIVIEYRQALIIYFKQFFPDNTLVNVIQVGMLYKELGDME